jgi:serine/threonine protein kinase
MLKDSYKELILPDEADDVKINFKIGELLGKGAFGHVFKAIDMKLGCECAVKIIVKNSMLPKAISMLKMEA